MAEVSHPIPSPPNKTCLNPNTFLLFFVGSSSFLKSCPTATAMDKQQHLHFLLAGTNRYSRFFASGATLRSQHDGLSLLQQISRIVSWMTLVSTLPQISSGSIPAGYRASEWMVTGHSLDLQAPACARGHRAATVRKATY